MLYRDFPAVQWLGLRASTAGGAGLIPGQGAKIPHDTWHSPKRKQSKCRIKVSLGYGESIGRALNVQAERVRNKLEEPEQEGMSQVKTGERGSSWCEAKEERVLAWVWGPGILLKNLLCPPVSSSSSYTGIPWSRWLECWDGVGRERRVWSDL